MLNIHQCHISARIKEKMIEKNNSKIINPMRIRMTRNIIILMVLKKTKTIKKMKGF